MINELKSGLKIEAIFKVLSSDSLVVYCQKQFSDICISHGRNRPDS